jgi:peptidoglycan/xylan/chitin deacetylase (PgdA/CDA1 family)
MMYMEKSNFLMKLCCIATAALFLLSGCSPGIHISAVQIPAAVSTPAIKPTFTSMVSVEIKSSPMPTKAPALTQTLLKTPTQTGETTFFGPGEVDIPVLLYHHVLLENKAMSKYAVEVKQFITELEYLKDQGYQTITVAQMVEAVIDGRNLPDKPIVITFDDGNRDVYENAFPALQALDFTATVYLIASETGYSGRLKKEMILEMADAGWEFGSHSMTHADLRNTRDEIEEVCTSRTTLMKELGLQIQTFAYPFGVTNDRIKQLVRDCGYTSGAGLGLWVTQSPTNIFYYNRREVESRITLDAFKNLLVPTQP